MTSAPPEAETIYDNTGTSSPLFPARSWNEAKLPWPVGPYVGRYPDTDPRTTLAARLDMITPDGFVIVTAAEIRAIFEMRVCRSTQDFDRDEDGPLAVVTAHCLLEAGHGQLHTNGYYSWKAQPLIAAA